MGAPYIYNISCLRVNYENDNFEAFEIKHILWPKLTPGRIQTALCTIFTCLSNVKGRDKYVWKPGCRDKANDVCRKQASKCTAHVMTVQQQKSRQVMPSTEDATSCQ